MCSFDTPIYVYYSHIAVFVLSLITAFLILMRNPKEASNRNAFYFILFVALFTADVFAQWTIHNLAWNVFFVKISYIGDFIVLFYLYFACSFTRTKISFKNKFILAIPFLLIIAAPFLLNAFSYFDPRTCEYIGNPVFIYTALFLDLTYVYIATWILIKYYKNPLIYVTSKYQIPVLIGAIWFFIIWNIIHETIGIVSFDLGNYIENTPHFIIGNLFFVSLIAFAIIKRDLFQFNTVLTTIFTETLKKMKNPFYIDIVPEYSSGGVQYPYRSLKTYIMSPFSDKKSNSEFVSFMSNLKKNIDSVFDFNRERKPSARYSHPLK